MLKIKIFTSLTCFSLLLSSCSNTPGPVSPTATPPVQNTQTANQTPEKVSLQAIDDGAPLPPRVISRQPSGAEELPPGGEVRLQFDQPMDADRTAGALQITDADGQLVPGEVDWPDERTLRFRPSQRLDVGALYFAGLQTEAASEAGATLEEPYGFQFQTTADLQVSQVFPADGTRDIDPDGVITVIFNRPVVPLVINEEQDALPNPLVISPQTAGSGEWINTSVYAFRPEAGLKAGVDYTVAVEAGLQDAANESSLQKAFTWNFSTTQPDIEWFALSDGRYNPQDNADKVLLDEYFSIKFLQAMDPAGVEAALSLTQSTNQREIDFTTEWQLEDTLLVFTPTQQLAPGSQYALVLDRSAPAATGGTIANELDWNFTTVPLPAVLSTKPGDGARQDQYSSNLTIQFASPMRIETVKSHISISPQPEEPIEWYYNDWDWSISGFFLKPSTEYVIRLRPGMEDIYGNRITTEKAIRFTTAGYDPAVRLVMPYEAPMLRAGEAEAQQFYASYTNVDRIQIELYALSQEQFIRLLSWQTPQNTFNPAASTLVWRATEDANRQLDEPTVTRFSPTARDGGLLQPGFYFLGIDAPGVRHDGRYADTRILFVAGANLTFKTTTTGALAWLTDLESGAPLADEPISFWDDYGNRLAAGSTNADGTLQVDLPAPVDSYNRYAVVNTSDIFAFASSSWGSGISASDYGIWLDMYAPTNAPTAYVYTERPIYRPGQPVYFKGILRVDNDLDYTITEIAAVRVKIDSFEETVYDEELSVSEFGTFSARFNLDEEAALGYYTIQVLLPDRDDPVGSVNFNVAEYRRPEFQVNVEAGPANVLIGESFTAIVQADYYSGGGVAGAEIRWSLASDHFTFQPPDEYSTYSFTDTEEDVWGYRDTGVIGLETIAEGTGTTDSSGRFTIELPVDLSETTSGRQLIFEATVTDVAQTAVSGRAGIVAHPSKVYPGIRSHSYVGEVGEEQTFDIVVLNWDGKPLADHPLIVEIVERRWYSVQEQDASGRIEWKSTVEETPVETFAALITDSDGEAAVTFTPDKGGIYRARVSAADDQGNEGHASAFLWVAGDDYIPWQQTNDRGFDLILDRQTYQPGETARVLIASPFQGETYALVTVERGQVRSHEVVLLTKNSTIYELPITADMAPNAYISVLVVKGIDETNPRPSFKMGYAAFDVDPSRRQVFIQVTPDRERVGPGEQVQYAIKTVDADGQPVSAELSISLSDLATLSLLPPNSAPIMDHFYAERNLAVWTSVALVNNLEDFNVDIEEEVQAGEGAGGGGGKGDDDMGVIAVRQDFPDTALWEAHIVTDSAGEASVTVKLPDNLTTWRVDARAVTTDTQVGQTSGDIVSSRPLLLRPQTPRFFIENDRALLGAAVHNNTQETLTVDVSLDAQGLELAEAADKQITLAAQEQAYVTWEARVPADSKRVDLIFRAAADGSISGRLEDASRPPQGTLDNGGIPVYQYTAPETVGTSGQLTAEGTRVEGLLLPQSLPVDTGKLTVEVAPSLAAGMTSGLEYLQHFPYECIEQTISRFLPNVLATQAMHTAGLADPALSAGPETQVGLALQRLYSAQNSDGGWGWWSGGKSEPLTSAYVALGLYEADQAGYTVDASVVERSLNYLSRQVKPLTGLRQPYLINRQAFILYVLAHAERPAVSSTEQLFEQRQRMALYSQAFLTGALWEIDPTDPRLDTLVADFAGAAIVSAIGTHWEEAEVDRWNWNTDTRTTALVLAALSRIDPKNPINANAVRWLMSNRSNGHWQGTQETAWTLMALTRWMEGSGELQANYDYAVALNGAELGSGVADRTTLQETQTFTVDLSEMLADSLNRLAFARDDGPGNLYYTAHLDVSLPVEQIEALDQGIVVARNYYRQDESETPVTEAEQGELLLARVTVVAPQALHYLIVNDPLPAGLEAVDQSLSINPQNVSVPQQITFEELWQRGWGWWLFDRIDYHDEKIVLSADYLPAGTYVYTYLVRASTPGEFRVIPPTAQEFYFPEVYGRGAGGLFVVKP